MNKKRFINDIVLIIILLLIPVAFIIFNNINNEAVDPVVKITIDGAIYRTLSLSEDTQLQVITDEGYNTIIVAGGEVWVEDADCPEKICVAHRPVSKNGEQIVCLPHKVVLEIMSLQDSDIDSLSQ